MNKKAIGSLILEKACPVCKSKNLIKKGSLSKHFLEINCCDCFSKFDVMGPSTRLSMAEHPKLVFRLSAKIRGKERHSTEVIFPEKKLLKEPPK